MGREGNFGQFENMEAEKSTEAVALTKAQQVASAIDPELIVVIQDREERMLGAEEWNDARLFLFYKESDPRMEWAMHINTDPSYVENELAGVIEKVYAEKTEQNSQA